MKNTATIDVAFETNNHLVAISEVKKGEKGFTCPFCHGQVLPKMGSIKIHHFAHLSESCIADSTEIFEKSYRKKFDSVLDFTYSHKTEQVSLKRLIDENKSSFEIEKRLGKVDIGTELQKSKEFFEEISRGNRNNHLQNQRVKDQFEIFLKTGEVPEFNLLSSSKIEKWIYFQENDKDVDFPCEITSWDWQEIKRLKDKQILMMPVQIYPSFIIGKFTNDKEKTRLENRKAVLQERVKVEDIKNKFVLYFLRINNGEFYKIGITARPINNRVQEIKNQLKAHQIEVLGTFKNCAFLESYFIYHYDHSSYKPFEESREYFKFSTVDDILQELKEVDFFINDFETYKTDKLLLIGKVCNIKDWRHRDNKYIIEKFDEIENIFVARKVAATEIIKKTIVWKPELCSDSHTILEDSEFLYFKNTVLPTLEKINFERLNKDFFKLLVQLNKCYKEYAI